VGIYPTLISSWIKGDTLLKFLEKSSEMKMLPSQTKLLAKKFREIAEKMESLKMAHGDLSGKNIMIEQGYKIKLIDYDGVYIPEFKNQPPKESGTRHYQHKSRLDGTINFYDESMDRFSIMLIYLSLMAISHNPQLFAKYHDDDNIIFKQSDLENPNGSEVFKELFKIPNEEIKYLTRKFQDYCKLGDPRKITKLELSIPKAQSGI